ncbi:DUF4136 domain-containing protein [Tsuneonella mangrovi]|uniref:DUF4136 domain-containing protein n=1 Tax=Tsuneonella mangrovi TaxID=1982042 RepID=UPI000BA20A83|nr:DUF4136 domain-containing protein [Tsuneonella mangrovi]
MRGKFAAVAAAALALSPIAASPAHAGNVEVSRFHTPESMANAQPGPIALVMGPSFKGSELEGQAWLDAVGAAMTKQGFTVDPTASRVAEVSLEQQVVADNAPRTRSGVSVGVGTGSGYYGGSGVSVGVGLGFLFGKKKPRGRLATTLEVTLKDEHGNHLWEGRAQADLKLSSKDAQPARLAPEMADALFKDFPGESGATIGAR